MIAPVSGLTVVNAFDDRDARPRCRRIAVAAARSELGAMERVWNIIPGIGGPAPTWGRSQPFRLGPAGWRAVTREVAAPRPGID